jgi:hypothetical protein
MTRGQLYLQHPSNALFHLTRHHRSCSAIITDIVMIMHHARLSSLMTTSVMTYFSDDHVMTARRAQPSSSARSCQVPLTRLGGAPSGLLTCRRLVRYQVTDAVLHPCRASSSSCKVSGCRASSEVTDTVLLRTDPVFTSIEDFRYSDGHCSLPLPCLSVWGILGTASLESPSRRCRVFKSAGLMIAVSPGHRC